MIMLTPLDIMTQFATTSSRWAALQSRNPAAANAFIYSVITTKIYCRPTCPSRLARRANIVFHKNSFDAEAEGFRPCKRCHPQVIENDGDPQRVAIGKACKLLKEDFHTDARTSVKALAAKVGLTECHFCRVFKKIMGVTVGEYKRQLASVQKFEDGKENFLHSSDSPMLSTSPTSTIAQEDFVFDPIWDEFLEPNYANDALFGTDLMPDAQSIFATDLTINNNIFDFVDFGQSSS